MWSAINKKFIRNKSDIDHPLINILTRTSGRPFGFAKCRDSVQNQTYNHIRHLVSYDNEKDLEYLSGYEIEKVKVQKTSLDSIKPKDRPNHLEFAPYNLYCNELLKRVKEGWVLFLDDDDVFLHDRVLETLVSKIKENDNRTLFIWQMQYPDGSMLPTDEMVNKKELELYGIGSPCVMFHYRYARKAKWDAWKCADFRFIKKLHHLIPKKLWIKQGYIKLNNFGGLGNREDVV